MGEIADNGIYFHFHHEVIPPSLSTFDCLLFYVLGSSSTPCCYLKTIFEPKFIMQQKINDWLILTAAILTLQNEVCKHLPQPESGLGRSDRAARLRQYGLLNLPDSYQYCARLF